MCGLLTLTLTYNQNYDGKTSDIYVDQNIQTDIKYFKSGDKKVLYNYKYVEPDFTETNYDNYSYINNTTIDIQSFNMNEQYSNNTSKKSNANNDYNVFSNNINLKIDIVNNVEDVYASSSLDMANSTDIRMLTSDNSKKDKDKCIYCGANMKANCHAHARWCPFYCNDDVDPIPLNFDISSFAFLITLSIVYILIKKYQLFK